MKWLCKITNHFKRLSKHNPRQINNVCNSSCRYSMRGTDVKTAFVKATTCKKYSPKYRLGIHVLTSTYICIYIDMYAHIQRLVPDLDVECKFVL